LRSTSPGRRGRGHQRLPASGHQRAPQRVPHAQRPVPCFDASPASLLGGSLGFFEAYGDWASEESVVGTGLAAGGYTGGQASGPLVLFNATGFGGPGGSPRRRSSRPQPVPHHDPGPAGGRGQPPAWGPRPGYLDVLAPGYSQRVVLQSSCDGVVEATGRWGAALQQEYNTSRLGDADDLVSSKLSYFTDSEGAPSLFSSPALSSSTLPYPPPPDGSYYSCSYWPLHPQRDR
jgi:hypothetical protein